MQALALQSSRFCSSGSARLAAAPRPAARAVRNRPIALRTLAAVKPPQGVTLPPVKPVVVPSSFGFVEWAEKINGRAAMLGFILLLLIEGFSGTGILNLTGITTGKGLGFEF